MALNYYYSLAANLNNSDAQYNLGMIYLGRKNINKAIKNLLLSANQNNSDAQFELGFIWMTKKDHIKACHDG